MSVYARIQAGEYENKLVYPSKPSEPKVLGQAAKTLTDQEIATIPAVRAAYQTALSEYESARRAYREEGGAIAERLRLDLEAETGVSGHPKAGLLWTKAWEHGHSAGWSEIANYYIDFAELLA